MKTLKLDSSYRPVAVIDSIEALVLCIIGKAKAIERYAETINSVKESFELPAVIVLNKYIKFRFSYMSCNKMNILWRDNNQCQYCSKPLRSGNLTIDHILPKSKGGNNSWLNLVAACKRCNQKKGDKTPAESGMYLKRKPYIPKTNILKSINKEQISPKWKNYLWALA